MRRFGVGLLLLAAAVGLLAMGPELSSAGHPKLVRIYYENRTVVQALVNAGADVVEVRDGYMVAVLRQDDIEWIRSGGLGLRSGKLSIEIVMENADDIFRPFRDKPALGAYHTWGEVQAELQDAASRHSGIARLFQVGSSVEGKPILALKISDNPDADENEDRYLMTGMHHAREWISVEVPMALIQTLLGGYGTDRTITDLVNEREIWVLPVVNPDGLVYSQTQFKMWRKNLRLNRDGTHGVDLNRNYAYQWGGAGASPTPYSDIYRGEAPFSEPEIQAIRNLATARPFKGAISFHSYSELVLWPWGYTETLSPDEERFARFGRAMAGFNGYGAGAVGPTLYLASGGFDDYLYGQFGTLAYTFELGREFVPPESEIAGIVQKNVPAALWFMGNCCGL